MGSIAIGRAVRCMATSDMNREKKKETLKTIINNNYCLESGKRSVTITATILSNGFPLKLVWNCVERSQIERY